MGCLDERQSGGGRESKGRGERGRQSVCEREKGSQSYSSWVSLQVCDENSVRGFWVGLSSVAHHSVVLLRARRPPSLSHTKLNHRMMCRVISASVAVPEVGHFCTAPTHKHIKTKNWFCTFVSQFHPGLTRVWINYLRISRTLLPIWWKAFFPLTPFQLIFLAMLQEKKCARIFHVTFFVSCPPIDAKAETWEKGCGVQGETRLYWNKCTVNMLSPTNDASPLWSNNSYQNETFHKHFKRFRKNNDVHLSYLLAVFFMIEAHLN